MVTQPELSIAVWRGIFYTRERSDVASLVTRDDETMAVGSDGAHVRQKPDHSSSLVRWLEPGAYICPFDDTGDWYLVRLPNPFQVERVDARSLVH